MRISDWSSDVCSSDLLPCGREARQAQHHEDPADAQEAQDEDLCAQVRQEKDRDQEEIEEVPRPGHPDKAPAPAPPGRNLTRGPEAQQELDREEGEQHAVQEEKGRRQTRKSDVKGKKGP